MITPSLGLVVLLVTLLGFCAIGWRAARSDADLEDYFVARRSQGGVPLGLSFLATGMGAWILFAPPEVGAGVGLVATLGYALGAAGPIVAFALLGRRMRRVVPEGHSLTEFVRLRFGRTFHLYVVGISLMYMLLFLTAELTAFGAVAGIVAGIDARTAVIALAVATLAYTTYGGLRASLSTDQWQAWLIVALLAVAAIALASDLPSAGTAFGSSGLLGIDRLGLEVALTLIIAVTAANLFHQGYWQRVWAARDERALGTGAALGALLVIPVVAVVGILGIMAAGGGLDLGSPPAPFFALLGGLPDWVGVLVIVLGTSLVASSVDTLENGLASLVAAERGAGTLSAARIVTIALMVPAVIVALQGYSVLRLFLIADLLCAATVVPALLGLWQKATARAALAGAVAGLAGAIVPGWISTGSLVSGMEAATFPGAVPTLAPFFWALAASSFVAIGASLAGGREFDLASLGGRLSALGEES